ncbi:scavenger receptor cysteine-rich domain-containing protein SCART1-like [Patagioenas fasciata]|uniref:scavenger receptor cysteine-rich domain-containing protein SCART1-like n=1 Tax=Patagioenas fasciata TaxID=372321 RepID=UPI003A999FFC
MGRGKYPIPVRLRGGVWEPSQAGGSRIRRPARPPPPPFGSFRSDAAALPRPLLAGSARRAGRCLRAVGGASGGCGGVSASRRARSRVWGERKGFGNKNRPYRSAGFLEGPRVAPWWVTSPGTSLAPGGTSSLCCTIGDVPGGRSLVHGRGQWDVVVLPVLPADVSPQGGGFPHPVRCHQHAPLRVSGHFCHRHDLGLFLCFWWLCLGWESCSHVTASSPCSVSHHSGQSIVTSTVQRCRSPPGPSAVGGSAPSLSAPPTPRGSSRSLPPPVPSGFCWCSVLAEPGTGELRLVGGGGRCAGRVEVKHDGEWGSVCNLHFNWETTWATVVCRQLGCGGVAKASAYAPFGQGTGRIWLHPFWCRGTEEMLHECPNFGWGRHFCGHEWDLGVICREAVELRLVAGGGPCAGRVEAKLRGQWGSVADGDWNMNKAEVVCRHLGCGSATGAYTAADSFGKGDGPIGLAVVHCRGDEASLWDCQIYGWGPIDGDHIYDVAVTCQGFARLVGGDTVCAGRLEVRRGQTWASVCQEHVDMKAAQVLCRELGCGTVLAVHGTGQSGAGTEPLWDLRFECSGTETLLSACSRQPPRSPGCTSHAGIVCSPYTGFRLAGESGCAGRVEVEVGGTWGSLCATGWDLRDAHVLCRHLGCGAAIAVPPGGSFGGGDGPMWRDGFGCDGSEWHPGQCPAAVLGEPPCAPGHAAAVNCSGVAEPLRLVEGESRCDGRLEVTASPGTWARVAAGPWDSGLGSVVCRQLGCGVLEKVSGVPGLGTVALRCAGTEESLARCNVSGTGAAPTGSPEEVAVVCSGSRRVRLAGGPGRCAGRVELYANGTWASACQDSWDLPDATVVCRQLGCGSALAAPGAGHFGAGVGTPWPDAGGCTGTEASLWACPGSARRGCRRGGGAGAVCSDQLSLRLAGGSGRCAGRLEVLHNGTWGGVCANGTSPATAIAACRQLGCGDGGRLEPAPPGDAAPAWLAWVGCEKGTRWLWRCPSAPWRLQDCGPGGDTHVACDEDSDGTSGTPTPSPGVPSSTALMAAAGSVPVSTVLCVVLGTLLFLALGALAVQMCCARARRRGPGGAADAISDAIYEELDYTPDPEYQEVPSGSGSLSEGSGTKLPYYSGGGVEESDPKTAPESPAQHSSPDVYDDAAAVPEVSPAPSAGDISEGVARRSLGCPPPPGGSCHPSSPAEATGDPPGHTDYDDVGGSTLGTSL